VGKTFKDQRRYDRKAPKGSPRLPRVQWDMNTGEKVITPLPLREPKHKKVYTEDYDETLP
jgi:hypothetical protein